MAKLKIRVSQTFSCCIIIHHFTTFQQGDVACFPIYVCKKPYLRTHINALNFDCICNGPKALKGPIMFVE